MRPAICLAEFVRIAEPVQRSRLDRQSGRSLVGSVGTLNRLLARRGSSSRALMAVAPTPHGWLTILRHVQHAGAEA
jgi:hypothetical protein